MRISLRRLAVSGPSTQQLDVIFRASFQRIICKSTLYGRFQQIPAQPTMTQSFYKIAIRSQKLKIYLHISSNGAQLLYFADLNKELLDACLISVNAQRVINSFTFFLIVILPPSTTAIPALSYPLYSRRASPPSRISAACFFPKYLTYADVKDRGQDTAYESATHPVIPHIFRGRLKLFK